MIKPNHEDWWSRKRTTNLRYRDGVFHTAGTSLPVLYDAFRDEGLCWYSLAYGDVYNDIAENLRLIAVAPNRQDIPTVEPYAELGPLQMAIGPDSPINEYLLSESVRNILHLSDEKDAFAPTEESDIRYAIHTHDDCFGSVKPVERGVLTRLVHSTLKLHSYYLGEEVDWQNVPSGLTELLETVGDFNISSNRRRKTVLVRPSERRCFDRSYLAKITIVHGKAVLHPGDSR